VKKYLLKIEEELHKELKHWAVDQNKTINDVIVGILRDWMYGQEEPESPKIKQQAGF
jgi:hypothetical protein